MLIPVILLLVGLAVLIKSSEAAINKAIQVAKLSGFSHMTIGFILLAVMTSLPELAVTVTSSLQGSDLSLGTLFGSNVANLALIMGIVAVLSAFTVSKKEKTEITHALFLTALVAFGVLMLGGVNPIIGLFLLIIFFFVSKDVVKEDVMSDGFSFRTIITWEMTRAVLLLAVSVVFVLASAYLVTQSSIEIALLVGIPETIIGATIVAIGTSLPELTVTLQAVRKKNTQLAIGNITGSLVANVTLILGIAGLLATYTFTTTTSALIVLMIFANILFYVLIHDRVLSRKNGIALLIFYALFTILMTAYF